MWTMKLARTFFGKEVRMMKEEEKKEGVVRDLIEKKKRREMTSKEIKQEIYRRGLQHERYGNPWIMNLSMIGWGILCFISVIAKKTHLPMLEPLNQLPTIRFPSIIRYSAVIFILLTIIIMSHAAYLRAKKGGSGLRGESETIILIKEGPYRIMRHPSHLGFYGFFILLTVILSEYVPFNILSVIGNLFFCLGGYHLSVAEEKLNTLKWGDEYRQYMKEVPRFNFILGIWRWAKRKRK